MSKKQTLHSLEDLSTADIRLDTDGGEYNAVLSSLDHTLNGIKELRKDVVKASSKKKQKASKSRPKGQRNSAPSPSRPMIRLAPLTVGGRPIWKHTSTYETARIMMAQYGSYEGIVERENTIVSSFGAQYYLEVLNRAKTIEQEERSDIIKTYVPSKEFIFCVKQCHKVEEDAYRLKLEDKKGRVFRTVSSFNLHEGKNYIFKIVDVNPDSRIDCMLSLRMMRGYRKHKEVLKNPEQPEKAERDSRVSKKCYKKEPAQWRSEVLNLGHHKCGKDAICSCCGEFFKRNQGVRVDGREIYFCNDCKKKVYHKSGRGWPGAIIFTPMGNKR